MRQIKFKAWDRVSKKMWPNTVEIRAVFEEGYYPCPNSENVDFLQFTGLLDKNEVEIYEGDILRAFRFTKGWGKRPARNEELIFEVRWSEKYHALTLWYPRMKWEALLGMDGPYEVIGNIYENPELIK